MTDKVGDKLTAIFDGLIEPGETVEGMCFGSRSGFMSGKFVSIATTDRRVIVQETSRKHEPVGEPLSLTPERIASAKIGGAGGFGGDVQSTIMNKTSLAITIKTTDGEKVKLMVGRATGPLGGLMGGPTQATGVSALGTFLERNNKT